MLPLAFSLGTILNALVLWMSFEKEFGNFSKMVRRSLLQAFSVSVIVGFVAHNGLKLFAPVFETDSLLGIFSQGLFAGLLGIIAGIIVLFLLKSRELGEVWSAVHTKFWKEKVIATDPEIV